MKVYLILFLIVTVGFSAECPASQLLVSRATVVAPTDSLLLAHKKQLRKHHAPPVDGVAAASALAVLGIVLAFVSLSAGGVLIASILSVLLGIGSLIRIGKSRRRLGGRALASISIVLGVLGLAFIALLIAAYSNLGR